MYSPLNTLQNTLNPQGGSCPLTHMNCVLDESLVQTDPLMDCLFEANFIRFVEEESKAVFSLMQDMHFSQLL